MISSEVKSKVNDLASAWEEFKSTNDSRLKELEKKGNTDPLFSHKLDQINKSIDDLRTQIDFMTSRPKKSVDIGQDGHRYNLNQKLREFLQKNRFLQARSIKALDPSDYVLNETDVSGADSLIMPKLFEQISANLFDKSALRQVCRVETTSNFYQYNVVRAINGPSAAWLGANDAINSNNFNGADTQVMHNIEIKLFDLYTQPMIDLRLMEDTRFDILSWIEDQVSMSFGSIENQTFLKGDGSSAPEGILSYISSQSTDPNNSITLIKSGENGSLTNPDALISMYFNLNTRYMDNIAFVGNRFFVGKIRSLKDNYGRYLWEPSISSDKKDTLMGAPIYMTDDLDAPSNGSVPLLLGNFKKAYMIVERPEFLIIKDNYTTKPYLRLYMQKRVGARVVEPMALKALQLSQS